MRRRFRSRRRGRWFCSCSARRHGSEARPPGRPRAAPGAPAGRSRTSSAATLGKRVGSAMVSPAAWIPARRNRRSAGSHQRLSGVEGIPVWTPPKGDRGRELLFASDRIGRALRGRRRDYFSAVLTQGRKPVAGGEEVVTRCGRSRLPSRSRCRASADLVDGKRSAFARIPFASCGSRSDVRHPVLLFGSILSRSRPSCSTAQLTATFVAMVWVSGRPLLRDLELHATARSSCRTSSDVRSRSALYG